MSYVAVDNKVCPICGKKHSIGVLLDRRLREDTFKEKDVVTGYENCPECVSKLEDGYMALVEISDTMPEPEGDKQPTKNLEDVTRTGRMLWIRRDCVNVGNPSPMAWIDKETYDELESRVAQNPAAQLNDDVVNDDSKE